MAHLTWKDAKEIVEITLELDYPNQDILKELRMRTGAGLIEAVQQLHGLLAVADHPKAQERYEAMRQHITRCANAPDWLTARLKLRSHMPIGECL